MPIFWLLGDLFSVVMDGENSYPFDRRIIRQNKDICALSRRRTLLQRGCHATLKNVTRFNMPAVENTNGMSCFLHLLHLGCNVDVAYEFHGLVFRSFEDPVDELYLVQNGNA